MGVIVPDIDSGLFIFSPRASLGRALVAQEFFADSFWSPFFSPLIGFTSQTATFAVIPSITVLYSPIVSDRWANFPLLERDPTIFSSSALVRVIYPTRVDQIVQISRPSLFGGHGIITQDALFEHDGFFLATIRSAVGQEISTLVLDSQATVFSPIVSGMVLSSQVVDASMVIFPPLVVDAMTFQVMDAEFRVFSHIASSVNNVNIDYTLDEGAIIFIPRVVPEGVSIEFSPPIPSSNFFFESQLLIEKVLPLSFKRAESPTGGGITQNDVFSNLTYRPVRPLSLYNTREDFDFFFARGILNNHIDSSDALFSKVFYRGFYIKNESVDRKANIRFWIDGGSSYRIRNSAIDKVAHESLHLLEAEEELFGVKLLEEDRQRVILGGSGRTSLFDQVKVSYLVSDVGILYPFDEDGVGLGISLPQERFTIGNQATFLPDLEPRDYVGIYLKIEVQFRPDFPIHSDYVFFHLESFVPESQAYERYPGQLRSPEGRFIALMMPSLSMRISTTPEKVGKYIDEGVVRLYDRYPPYFLGPEEEQP